MVQLINYPNRTTNVVAQQHLQSPRQTKFQTPNWIRILGKYSSRWQIQSEAHCMMLLAPLPREKPHFRSANSNMISGIAAKMIRGIHHSWSHKHAGSAPIKPSNINHNRSIRVHPVLLKFGVTPAQSTIENAQTCFSILFFTKSSVEIKAVMQPVLIRIQPHRPDTTDFQSNLRRQWHATLTWATKKISTTAKKWLHHHLQDHGNSPK